MSHSQKLRALAPLFTYWVITLSCILLYMGISMVMQLGEVKMTFLPFILLVWGLLQIASLWKNTIILSLCCFMNLVTSFFVLGASYLAIKDDDISNAISLFFMGTLFILTGAGPLVAKWKNRTV